MASLGARLREKTPELLFEAASIVFAVLIALGVDEWRESRANRALAARARDTIVAEIRANRDEMATARPDNQKIQRSLPAQITEIEAGRSNSAQITWQVAQLSSAGWQAAQATQATQFMDYRWVVEAARLYELQRLYVNAQEDLMLRLGDIGANPVQSLKLIQSRMALLESLDGGIAKAAAEVLAAEPPR